MAERYTRIYTLPPCQYAPGSPVVLESGTLLRDSMTGHPAVHLQFRNIGPKPIRMLRIAIFPKDIMGQDSGDPVPYQYLNLDARRGCEFGAQQPIALPNVQCSSFSIRILETVYADNSVTGSAITVTVNAMYPAGKGCEHPDSIPYISFRPGAHPLHRGVCFLGAGSFAFLPGSLPSIVPPEDCFFRRDLIE